MGAAGGKRMLVTAALLVAGIRMWMQVRGKAKTPFAEWAIGWGALFFLLSIFSEAYPAGAGSLALTIVVGDVLVNGTSLFTDISGAITGAEKGQPVLAPTPFGPLAATTTVPSKNGRGAVVGGGTVS